MCWTKCLFIITLGIAVIIASCNSRSSNTLETGGLIKCDTGRHIPLRNTVLTANDQKAISPDEVIQNLKDGNKRYVHNNLTATNDSAMIRNAAGGQYPKAVILSCVDSRIPVEQVFNMAIGDVFIARIAGNFIDNDILGSMEYGCKVAGAKLIVVLGHGSCGAVKGVIEHLSLGNITGMLANLEPAVARSQGFRGDKTEHNEAYVEAVAKNNVAIAITNISAKSPILAEMARKGKIKIVGAYYNIKTGEVTFL